MQALAQRVIKMNCPGLQHPFWPWLYYVTTLVAMGLWMKFGYKNGFDIVTDGPGLVLFVGSIGGMDFLSRLKNHFTK